MKVKELLAEGIKMGTTVENGGVRVHKYADLFRVTEMVNAGKRGKKVRTFDLSGIHGWGQESSKKNIDLLNDVEKVFSSNKGYDEMLKAANDFVKNAEGHYSVSEEEIKGIEVEQGKTEIDNGKISVNYSTKTFSITDLSDKINVPRAIPPTNSGKTDIAKFYKLMSNELNRKRIEKMNYYELLQFMTRNGIYYHEYMGMD